MSRIWMPLYVADYLADTGHLSAAEHGAYLLLIMHYWNHGGLPSDEAQIARITRLSPKEWRSSRATIAAFFDNRWRHERIEMEIANAESNRAKAAEKARKRWANRDAGAYAAALPGHMLGTCPSPSPSPSKTPSQEKGTYQEEPLGGWDNVHPFTAGGRS